MFATTPVTARRVEEVFQRTGRVIELCVGGRSISTTHEHPFYVEGDGWKQACALVPGDLLKSHDGQLIAVESLQDTQRDVTLYNMRIEEYHTYFVGCADWGFSVWAHNAKYNVSGGSTSADSALTTAEDLLGEGYTEIAPGVFRSADGTVQFRMTDSDLLGQHGNIGSHVHIESIGPNGNDIIENSHIQIL